MTWDKFMPGSIQLTRWPWCAKGFCSEYAAWLWCFVSGSGLWVTVGTTQQLAQGCTGAACVGGEFSRDTSHGVSVVWEKVLTWVSGRISCFLRSAL